MSYEKWKIYFKANEKHFAWLDLTNAKKLSENEKNVIYESIRQFQKGENSEGKNLIEYAKQYENEDYLEAIKDFIREEQRHAEVLGRFMALNGIARLRSHWVDSIFRKLRTLSGLENSVIVLLTAEIIAAVYYKALRDATSSEDLRKICKQILIDEEMHINFQSHTLKKHLERKSHLGAKCIRTFHEILMAGTIVIVWHEHKNVLTAGGYKFQNFQKEVWKEFQRAQKMIQGESRIICNVVTK